MYQTQNHVRAKQFKTMDRKFRYSYLISYVCQICTGRGQNLNSFKLKVPTDDIFTMSEIKEFA